MIITRKEAQQLMTPGTILRVVFTKRTTGELRLMVARVEDKQPMLEQLLVLVHDLDKNDYRYIPLEGIDGIRFDTDTDCGADGHWMTVRG